jgi:VWFA-related protein
MRRHGYAVLLLGCLNLFAQAPADFAVHIEVNLVQVDAVVTDGNGQPVKNLTSADFKILQDGKPQPISNFSWIDAAATTPPAGIGKPVETPGSGADIKEADLKRTISIVVDDLGLAWESYPAITRAVRSFIEKEKGPGDLISILSTSRLGPDLYRQFTSDPQLLTAAIDSLKYNLTENRVGIESFPSVNFFSRQGAPSMRQTLLQVATNHSIEGAIRTLRAMPGRKILVLISEHLPVTSDGLIQSIGDQAARASVVIYGIDPRGLPTLQVTAADDTSQLPRLLGNRDSRVAALQSGRASAYFQSQDGLVYLARQTGGLFFHDNNDLAAAFARIDADSAGYYLIGYQPDSATFKPQDKQPAFHRIEVQLARRDLHVRSRAGFFNSADAVPDTSRPLLRLSVRRGQIDSAFNSPFAEAAIPVRMTARFLDDPTRGAGVEGMLAIDANSLVFKQEPDGRLQADVEVVSRLLGETNAAPDFYSQKVTLKLTPETYRAALKNGVTCRVFRTVPGPGAYQVKVVLRDSNSEKIGSASQFLEPPGLIR